MALYQIMSTAVNLLPQEEYFLSECNSFCTIVEDIVQNNKMSYMDAVLFLAEKRGIDEQMAASLLNPVIKDNIRVEALQLHLMQPQAALPF